MPDSVAMPMTKRYFTFVRVKHSRASLILPITIVSQSGPMFSAAQKLGNSGDGMISFSFDRSHVP